MAATAALDAWRNGPVPPELDAIQRAYWERWAQYSGELFASVSTSNPYRNDPAIYQGTKLLWKHTEAVVDFYAGVVYQGALADDPEQGAIPWKLLVKGDPTEVDTDDAGNATPRPSPARNLWLAILELQAAWNWQQQMAFAPMYAAALGDCLTELVDDLDRRFVYPQIVWPGYVKDITIDYVGNVRAYTLEYPVEERDERGSVTGRYRYRKDVDEEAFRHYRDDKPFDKDGSGTAVMPNPYGFVPAVWDRHRIGAPGLVRGKSATDGTRQALLQLNSLFSHAFAYQRKAFFQPIVISAPGGGGTRTVDLSAPNGTVEEIEQEQKYITVPQGANLLQAQMDIGKTREMLQDIRENILAENPEASYYQQLREMSQVTAPGAERLMGDVKSRVDLVRAGADVGTVKRFQMAISMCGWRANGNDWKARNPGRALTPRQAVFLPFDLESFDRGELDCTILPRPLVPLSEQERLELILLKESIRTPWGMGEAGMSEDDITAITGARRAEADERAALFGRGVIPDDDEAA